MDWLKEFLSDMVLSFVQFILNTLLSFIDIFFEFCSYLIGLVFSFLPEGFSPDFEGLLTLLSFVDLIFPVNHFFVLFGIYITSLMVTSIYRMVKSFVPTISG